MTGRDVIRRTLLSAREVELVSQVGLPSHQQGDGDECTAVLAIGARCGAALTN